MYESLGLLIDIDMNDHKVEDWYHDGTCVFMWRTDCEDWVFKN